MPSANKIELKKEYEVLLDKYSDFIFTEYKGLDVPAISELRHSLKEKKVLYRVIKNRVFYKALASRKDISLEELKPHLKRTIAVAFIQENFPSVAKELQKVGEQYDFFGVGVGIMDSVVYSKDKMKEIAKMSTKEESLSSIASLLQSSVTSLAIAMNQIISSLARGIQAVGEKNTKK